MNNKFIKRYLKVQLPISIALYLMSSFIYWDILWIRLIPAYEMSSRCYMVFGWLIIQVYVSIIVANTQPKEK